MAPHKMLSKVPEITAYFWIIKVLCTTVGETGADFLNENLKFGLTNTTYITGALLATILVWQFKLKHYTAGVYWLAVVLLSIFGTLITDNMSENFNIPLVMSTILFSIALAVTFIAWYRSEGTLSIHSIRTTRREVFYWLAILFTFALGTASGDLVAEKLNVGYLLSVVLFGGIIAAIVYARYRLKLQVILSFWLAYILTRPLGASLGDLLSQPKNDGGLGLGTAATSALFLITILGLVIYLTSSKHDAIEE